MIKVKVGTTELLYDNAREFDDGRIVRLIAELRGSGQSVCVLVTVEEYPVDLLLPAGACMGVSGSRRQLRPEEQRIVEVWERHKLNKVDFSEGELVAFLKQ